MASEYEVTIKLYQHHVIQRHMHAVVPWTHAVGAINVLMYFIVVTLLFPKHSSAALSCKRFVNKFVNSEIRLFIIATPHHTQIVSFAIIKLLSLFNTMNHIGDTRLATPSMNELTTEYRNSLINIS